VKQPHCLLRVQDLLPKEFKVMAKDIKTINSKGVANNKSLFSKISSSIKLPRDEYLMPTLGVNVRDNMLALFDWCATNWGSFDVTLKNFTCNEIVEAIKLQREN